MPCLNRSGGGVSFILVISSTTNFMDAGALGTCKIYTEGMGRRGRARPQGEDLVGGAAIDDRLRQQGICLRSHRGGWNHLRLPRGLHTTARGPPLTTALAGTGNA